MVGEEGKGQRGASILFVIFLFLKFFLINVKLLRCTELVVGPERFPILESTLASVFEILH